MRKFEMADNRKYVRLVCRGDKIERDITDDRGNPIISDNPKKSVSFKVCGNTNMSICDEYEQRNEKLYSGDRVKIFLNGCFAVYPSFFSLIRKMMDQISEKTDSKRTETKYGIRL